MGADVNVGSHRRARRMSSSLSFTTPLKANELATMGSGRAVTARFCSASFPRLAALLPAAVPPLFLGAEAAFVGFRALGFGQSSSDASLQPPSLSASSLLAFLFFFTLLEVFPLLRRLREEEGGTRMPSSETMGAHSSSDGVALYSDSPSAGWKALLLLDDNSASSR
jgi:hypothetical protein